MTTSRGNPNIANLKTNLFIRVGLELEIDEVLLLAAPHDDRNYQEK